MLARLYVYGNVLVWKDRGSLMRLAALMTTLAVP